MIGSGINNISIARDDEDEGNKSVKGFFEPVIIPSKYKMGIIN